MARPRIFISSTYYDLRQVREDLERFVSTLGYDSVRHESGKIPYTKDQKLEASAYREIEFCDILICIIGGRFGSESHENAGYSITQSELKRAIEKEIPVFIFVEKPVLSEFGTYQLNKSNLDTKYKHVDDVRVFQYIEGIFALPKNNPITGFESSHKINAFLSEQWAGLFQRFLQQQHRDKEINLIEEVNSSVKTLRDLIKFITDEKRYGDEAIKSILLTNHPVFSRLAKLTKTGYRVFFTDRPEMSKWLKARNWSPADPDQYFDDSIDEWHHQEYGWLVFEIDLFDENNRLKNILEPDWKESWLRLVSPAPPDEDVPF